MSEGFNVERNDEKVNLEKRSVDRDFERRYNHLKSMYRGNPFAFDFFKYFLRNRGQDRHRRQIDVSLPSNGNGPRTSDDNNRQRSPIQGTNKREATKRTKPFRPPMVFF